MGGGDDWWEGGREESGSGKWVEGMIGGRGAGGRRVVVGSDKQVGRSQFHLESVRNSTTLRTGCMLFRGGTCTALLITGI